jgi:hypothetical protein
VARRNEFLSAPVHKMREPSLPGVLENRRQGGGGDFRRRYSKRTTACRDQDLVRFHFWHSFIPLAEDHHRARAGDDLTSSGV